MAKGKNKNDGAINSAWETSLGLVLRSETINGITMRFADTAVRTEDAARPIVLFMHGNVPFMVVFAMIVLFVHGNVSSSTRRQRSTAGSSVVDKLGPVARRAW